MAGGSNQEVQEEHGVVSLFFFSFCACLRVCMFVNVAMKRRDELREACERRGGGRYVPGDRCGLCPAATGHKGGLPLLCMLALSAGR